MLKGFRDFIMKGNVIDLATAVIIGTAFTAIVTAFTKGVVQPIINTIPISPNKADGLGFNIIGDKASTFVDLGSVITAVINFLIVAAVVYFIIVLPYNKLAELGGFGKKSEVTEVALLTEIRDLLAGEDTESKAKELAERELPDHLTGPGSGPVDTSTKRIAAPPVIPENSAPQPPYSEPRGNSPYSDAPYSDSPYSDPTPAQSPYSDPLSAPSPSYPDGPTTTYPSQPPAGPSGPGATPAPAPGSYPPPGNYPPPAPGGAPGQYPPPGQYPGPGAPGQYPPGQYPGDLPPDAPGRHSR